MYMYNLNNINIYKSKECIKIKDNNKEYIINLSAVDNKSKYSIINFEMDS